MSSRLVKGLVAEDMETGVEYELAAGVIINATGVFADSLRRMDDPASKDMISPSQTKSKPGTSMSRIAATRLI